MAAVAIGIDLGTSTSEIAVYASDGPRALADPGTKHTVVPSLIAVNTRGSLLVGEEATEFVDVPGQGAREVKRLMGSGKTLQLGGKEYRPEELSALVLRKLKTNAETVLGQAVTEVVLSVPANFNDAAKQATVNAARLAGLEVKRLINEPTAAAIAFGVNHLEAEAQLVVFDFGGGTLDVTTLEMMEGVLEVTASFGDTELGGKEFDEVMQSLILRKFEHAHGRLVIRDKSQRKLKAVAERAKIALSTHDLFEVRMDYFASNGSEVVDLEVEVTRVEFEQAVQPLLDRARECLRKALEAGQLHPSPANTILMVGGTTYIPCVRALVGEFFGGSPPQNVDPDLAVALGAATLAGIEAGLVRPEDELVFTDVCPMGIGIDVIGEVGGQRMLLYEALIKPNTKIPFSETYEHSLLRTDQEECEMNVFQTHLHDDAVPLEIGLEKGIIEDVGLNALMKDIPPSLSGFPHPLQVEFSYDTNGLVHIQATIPGLDRSINIDFADSATRANASDLDRGRQRLRELFEGAGQQTALGESVAEADWRQHPLAPRYQPLIEKAERMAEAHPKLSPALRETVSKLREALRDDDEETAELHADHLTDLLFNI